MMSDAMPLWTVMKAEQAVDDQLRLFRISAEEKIPIERVLLKYGARVTPLPGLVARHKVEAAIRRIRRGGDGMKFRVFVDKEIADGHLANLRLTLAEEAGHFLADGPTVLSVKTLEDTIHIHSNPEWIALERNREMIGRVWLAPNRALEKAAKLAYMEAISLCGFNSSAQLKIVSLIAARLEMPVEHVSRRINECSFDLREKISASISRRDAVLGEIYAESPKRTGKSRQSEMLF